MLYRIVDVRPGTDYHTVMTDTPTSQGSNLSNESRPSQRRVSAVPRIDSLEFNRPGLFFSNCLPFTCTVCSFNGSQRTQPLCLSKLGQVSEPLLDLHPFVHLRQFQHC